MRSMLTLSGALAVACSSTSRPPATPPPPVATTPGPPPGLYLAFNSTRDDNYEVMLVPAAGGEPVNLSRDPGTDWVYAGGEELLIVSTREARWKRPAYDLYSMSPRDGALVRLTASFPVHDSYLGRGPGGDRFVVTSKKDGDPELYVIDRQGGELAKLTDNEVGDGDPDWSPDGSSIVFRSDRAGAWDLWLMNADGTGARQLTAFPDNDGEPGYGGEGPPRWAPDGQRIIWASHRGGDWDVWVMDADGSNQRALADTPENEGWPCWSPDGSEIAFDSDRDGNYEIYVMKADGSGARRVTDHPAADLGAVWVTVR